MAGTPDQFEDPKLKAAVQKAFGAEHASTALRSRVLRAVQMELLAELPVATKSPRTIQRPAWMKYALAAVILLGAIGLYANWDYWTTPSLVPNEPTASLPIPSPDAMLAAHQAAAPTEFATRDIAETKLSALLGQKITIPELPGWTFKGAQPVSLAGHTAGRALYEHSGSHLSLFVILNENCAVDETQSYDEACNNVVVAGFIRKGINYCLLATPPSPDNAAEVNKLRDLLAKQP
jgi:hypothetical protein